MYAGIADENLNALSTSLGLGLSLQDNDLETSGEETTSVLGPSPLAAGVTSLEYNDVTGVEITPPAQALATTLSEAPFIGSQSVGRGAFVLMGDSNVLSDYSGDGYTLDDNGGLARNLCGTSTPPKVTTPVTPEVPPATTQATTPPAPPTPPPPSTPPAPVFGRSANVSTAAGTVRIELPGGLGFVTLSGTASIPVGSLLDTTDGEVQLTASTGAQGATETGLFSGGVFRLGQTTAPSPLHGGRTVGFTVLALAGAAPAGCGRGRGARRAGAGRQARAKARKLWGDAHGNFRTQGSYASATVRGTKWLTEDTCAGTLVRVARGIVSVDDFSHHRTVLVRAPHSFLAHPGAGG